jgi:hypothetical protein
VASSLSPPSKRTEARCGTWTLPWEFVPLHGSVTGPRVVRSARMRWDTCPSFGRHREPLRRHPSRVSVTVFPSSALWWMRRIVVPNVITSVLSGPTMRRDTARASVRGRTILSGWPSRETRKDPWQNSPSTPPMSSRHRLSCDSVGLGGHPLRAHLSKYGVHSSLWRMLFEAARRGVADVDCFRMVRTRSRLERTGSVIFSINLCFVLTIFWHTTDFNVLGTLPNWEYLVLQPWAERVQLI